MARIATTHRKADVNVNSFAAKKKPLIVQSTDIKMHSLCLVGG